MKNLLLTLNICVYVGIISVSFCQTHEGIRLEDYEPGTLEGSFSISPSGAAIYSIPLDLPPGRAGMTPGIALVYNSQQYGNILGRGWGLSGFSSVSRVNPTVYYNGAPDNIDFAGDQLVLDGEKLILVGENEYRPENDPVTKVLYLNGDNGDYFKVYLGNGLVKEYGNTLDSRQEYALEGPDNCPLIWHLNKIIDLQGNTIKYRYTKNMDSGEMHPLEVIYTGYEEEGSETQPGFYSIRFSYSPLDERLWQTYYYQKDIALYKNITSYILTNIRVKYIDGNITIRDYSMDYLTEATNVKNEYFLEEILVKVPTGEGEKVMKGASFDWSFYQPDYQTIYLGPDNYVTFDGDYRNTMCKLNIDGSNKDQVAVSKLIEANLQSVITVYFNQLYNSLDINVEHNTPVEPCAIDFDCNGDDELIFCDDNGVHIYDFLPLANHSWEAVHVYYDDHTGKIKVGDINGDALTDFFLVSSTSCYLYKATGNSNAPFTIQTITYPAFSDQDQFEELADFNGDGKADILWRDYPDFVYQVYSFENDDQFHQMAPLPLEYGVYHPDTLASYVDLNGDGKTDLCFTRNEGLENKKDCYFSYGDRFTGKITGDIGIDPTLVMDINNDGLADYIRLFNDENTLQIAFGMPDGKSHSQEIYSHVLLFTPTDPVNGIYDMILADIDGNGVQDLVTEFYERVELTDTRINPARADTTFRPYDGRLLKLYNLQDEGLNLDRVHAFENGFGAVQEVDYKPANQQPGTLGIYPVIKSREKMYVVGCSWLHDGVTSGLEINRTAYDYITPVIHTTGKGFLGFDSIIVRNYQNNTISTTKNQIYADGHKYYFSFPAESQTHTMVDNRPGILLNHTTNTLSTREFFPTNPPVFRAVVEQSHTQSWENDAEHSFIKTVATFVDPSDIDDYGNLTRHVNCADEAMIPFNEPRSTYRYEVIQNSTYYHEEDYWVVSRPSSIETIKKSSGNVDDDQTYTEFTYYRPGEVAPNGMISFPLLKEKISTPNYDDQFTLSVNYEYDKYGNIEKTESQAPYSSHQLPPVVSLYEYDETFMGRFLSQKTEGNTSIPFISTFHYDEVTGLLVNQTNPQGLQTTYSYDYFGRLKEIESPDHVKLQTLISWNNDKDISGGEATYIITSQKILNNKDATVSEPVKIYYNRLGQEILSVTYGINDSLILREQEYDLKGRLWKVSEPYFKNELPAYWMEYLYDELGRNDSIVHPSKSIAFDFHGLGTIITDHGTGIEVTRILDALGREAEIADPSGQIRYDYFSSGLVKSIDALGNRSDFDYDAAGNKITFVDPDAGTTLYEHNAYGQLTWQEDSKGNIYTLRYDDLNRLEEKILEGEGTQARYYYHDRLNDPGYGAIMRIDGDHSSYYYQYDAFSRLKDVSEATAGMEFAFGYTYSDVSGKLESITYPTNFQAGYSYDEKSGILLNVSDIGQSQVLWQANAANARGQLMLYTLGNGLQTSFKYDEFGYPSSIKTSSLSDDDLRMSGPVNEESGSLQYLTYGFEPATGNLSWRAATVEGVQLREDFTYDVMLHSRLTGWHVEGEEGQGAHYQENGNILAKSGITSGTIEGDKYHSTYVYGENAGPHAVTGITIPDEDYILHCSPQNIAYTSFNKIKSITHHFVPPSDNPGMQLWKLDVTYGPDEQRKQTQLFHFYELVKTKYFAGNLFEEEHFAGEIRKLHYLYAGDGLFAIYVMNGETDTMYYIHKDYLGSYDVVTDEDGAVVERMSFDPWGRRRNPLDWTYDGVSRPHLFDRGYTGHEHLDIFGLINMNGRVYDPWLGRFLSPDPIVQSPGNSQSYNRYSYCLNNPLKFVDPSGYTNHPIWIQNTVCWECYDWLNKVNSSSHSGSTSLSMSTPGSYRYSWSSGRYYNDQGNEVTYGEVFVNYIAPNSVDAPHSLFVPGFGSRNEGDQNKRPNSRPVTQRTLAAAIQQVILSRSSMMFGGILQDVIDDYTIDSRVNLLTSKNPILDIFNKILQELSKGSNGNLNNLFDIIIPNQYGPVRSFSQYYKNTIEMDGHIFQIRVLSYESTKDLSFYNIYQMGFGYLDRFSSYKPSAQFNGGFPIGFFIVGYEMNNLVLIGTQNIDSFLYLRSLFSN